MVSENITESSLLNQIIIGKNGIKLYSRLIEERDSQDIVEVVNWAYRGKGDIEAWATEKGLVEGPRLTEEMLKEDFSKSSQLVKLFLLEHVISDDTGAECSNRKIVGCVRIDRESEDSKEAVLGMLSVDPEYQGKGIGAILVKLAESEMKLWNVTESHLHVVNCRDTLLAWYYSIGYEKTTQTFPFVIKGNTPLKDIHFVLLIKKLK